jgi:serine/threonine protein kinase
MRCDNREFLPEVRPAMLEFSCAQCGRRLRLDEAWAGKKCRCSVCGQVVDVPQAASVGSSGGSSQNQPAAQPPAPPESGVSVSEMQTLPPTQADSVPGKPPGSNGAGPVTPARAAVAAEHYDFLAPAQSPSELGRLGGYRIVKVLGTGGMGVVFQAEDIRLKRPVALKAMLPLLAASTTNRQRFIQEAQAAAAIEHDHIVTIYQVDEDRGIPFIAMQLLKGETLEDRLQRTGRLPFAEALRIAAQIASGLAVAHDNGLIHRDIKPSNVWLEGPVSGDSFRDPAHHSPVTTQQTRVKLLDFGLARSITGESQLTKHGAIIGTPAYMAPEQSRGQPVDGRSDLFSLGCVLYRMCTGRMPFPGTDTVAILLALASENPPAPHQLNPQVPPVLSRLIMDLLAKDPRSRPQSARVAIQRIQELEHSSSPARAVRVPSSEAASHASGGPLPTPTILEPEGSSTDPHTAFLEQPPVAPRKKKWLLAACLAGGGLALVLGCVILLVILLNQPSGGQDGDDKKAEKDANKKAPVVRPIAQAVLDPETVTLLKDSLLKGNYSLTEKVGFPLVPDFQELAPDGGILIGFEVGLGNNWGKDHINSIRPIFLTEKGEVKGQMHGTPTNNMVTVKAKKGYAVGAVSIAAGLQVDRMKITFLGIDKKYLDTDRSYESEVIGPPGNQGLKTVGGTGALVIGICGKSNGQACQALGLVLRGKVKQ